MSLRSHFEQLGILNDYMIKRSKRQALWEIAFVIYTIVKEVGTAMNERSQKNQNQNQKKPKLCEEMPT